mgnify:CR=1 FL=1
MSDAPLLAVNHLFKHFPVRSGLFGKQRDRVHAVDDISFTLGDNETDRKSVV